MTDTLHSCPGCRGLCGDAVSMEGHEQSCILALRAAVAALEARVADLEQERQARVEAETWAQDRAHIQQVARDRLGW